MVMLVSVSAQALTPSQHISVGLLLADETNSNLEAFAVGFASHALTDCIRPKQYNFDIFNPSQGDYDIILLEGFFSALQIYRNRNDTKRLYAIAGAMAPDIIEAIIVLSNKDRWYKGDHVFPWHKGSNPERMGKGKTIFLSATLLTVSF
jgi:hypothetical protein